MSRGKTNLKKICICRENGDYRRRKNLRIKRNFWRGNEMEGKTCPRKRRE